jgi:uncharacterized protein YecE (DUF72 family)
MFCEMKTEYFLGCSGFYYNHWRGLFYPEKLGKAKWLQYYAEHFNTVELNNTFYRFPSESMLQGWYDKTPENFKFTLKANRLITHTRKFNNTEQFTASFYKLAYLLHEKLLCVLFQLPPFIQKNIELLEKIANQVDPKVTNVVEFRHESWWDSEVYAFMKKKGLVFCTVSASELPETLVATASSVYIRFHGKNGWYKHFYPEEELKEWAEKIKKQNAKRVFCYFNNDLNANAVKNCQTLKQLLGKD